MTDLEIMQRAKMYLDKLSQGIDPLTNVEVPDDSVLNNARLARCFFYVSGVLQQVIDNGGTVGAPPKKAAFTLEQAGKLSPADHSLRITEFAQYLGAQAGDNIRHPKTTLFTGWLVKNGFLEVVPTVDGKTKKLPTDAGKRIGLYAEIRNGQYGSYEAVYYSPSAQQFLIDHLEAILQFEKQVQDT